ncbi:MAG: ankyrin repeat domain-containing protein [Parachlamydia sp.]|nr:ankyrin repeat domain-containing protein [Parachlamydia sp.]
MESPARQSLIPPFSDATYALVRSRYEELVKDSINPKHTPVHWAIAEKKLEDLKKLTTFALLKLEMMRKCVQMAKEYSWSPPPEIEDQEVEEEVKAYVNDNNTKHGFTPMHIAVMTNSLDAAQVLLDSGKCQLDETDQNGATALHHAAVLGSMLFIQLLVSNGANETFQDGYGGTYQDILRLCHQKIDPAAQKVFVRIASGTVQEETGIQFFQRTKATLIDADCLLSPLLWLENWENIQHAEKLNARDVALRDRYLARRPAPVFWMDHDPSVGYYLRAGQKIPRFTILGDYLGKIDPIERKTKCDNHKQMVLQKANQLKDWQKPFFYHDSPEMQYGHSSIDAFAFRGQMALVADSFPNIVTRPIWRANGVYQRVIFVAAQDIDMGEILSIDYGNEHEVKRIPFKELRSEAMDTFFKTHSQDALIDILKKENSRSANLDQQLERLANVAMVNYLLNSPTAMLKLYLTGLISLATLNELFKLKITPGEDPFSLAVAMFRGQSMQEKFFHAMLQFDEECQKCKDPALVAQAKKDLLEKIGVCNTLELYTALKSLKT